MRTFKFTVFFIFIIFISCLDVHIYPGKALIVNRFFDNSLQDSALIYGYVLDAAEEKPLWDSSKILVEKTEISTFCDSTGYFFMKLQPGAYNIVCFNPIVTDDTLKLDNLKILPHEKVEIKFLKKVKEW
jgi:hypothetical protein